MMRMRPPRYMWETGEYADHTVSFARRPSAIDAAALNRRALTFPAYQDAPVTQEVCACLCACVCFPMCVDVKSCLRMPL